MSDVEVLEPEWPTPAGVRALFTTRRGGVSEMPYDSLNLGVFVDDDRDRVRHNRERLVSAHALPEMPRWLRQSHGVQVVRADTVVRDRTEADGAWTTERGIVCAVQVADCLPVLMATGDGARVAAIHAGWRGLAAGVLDAGVKALGRAPDALQVWLGPAIGAGVFEVEGDVRDAFVDHSPLARECFEVSSDGKWLADLHGLAYQRLRGLGVTRIWGGGHCTVTDRRRFFSHRRDRVTGRMAALIWRE